jgi:ATP phosphoribosyltransferase regulatory subunit
VPFAQFLELASYICYPYYETTLEVMNRTLLPAGCYDVLPPRARLETDLSYQLLAQFEAHGYQQVSPPMLEYTDSLLAGRGSALSSQIIRVMDPHTQKVMGFRADMTLQIARIATTRMSDRPRPLRLCYAGPILRMQADSMHAERQMRQAGIELIGEANAKADAEVIYVAMKALEHTGVRALTIDLNLPAMIGGVLAESSLDSYEIAAVFEALAHKDSARLKQFREPACDLLCELMAVSGDAKTALEKLAKLSLPEMVKPYVNELTEVVRLLTPHLGDSVHLTVDVTERGGFDYYTGVSFAFFASLEGKELGRGGRYSIDAGGGKSEAAIGCTFYTDSLRNLLPQPSAREKVYVVGGLASKDLDKLHAEGYVTLLALNDADGEASARAKTLGCTYIYQQEKLTKL